MFEIAETSKGTALADLDTFDMGLHVELAGNPSACCGVFSLAFHWRRSSGTSTRSITRPAEPGVGCCVCVHSVQIGGDQRFSAVCLIDSLGLSSILRMTRMPPCPEARRESAEGCRRQQTAFQLVRDVPLETARGHGDEEGCVPSCLGPIYIGIHICSKFGAICWIEHHAHTP